MMARGFLVYLCTRRLNMLINEIKFELASRTVLPLNALVPCIVRGSLYQRMCDFEQLRLPELLYSADC